LGGLETGIRLTESEMNIQTKKPTQCARENMPQGQLLARATIGVESRTAHCYQELKLFPHAAASEQVTFEHQWLVE
jgi:hypothetical protein